MPALQVSKLVRSLCPSTANHLPRISGIGHTVFSNWVDLVTLQQSQSIEGRQHD